MLCRERTSGRGRRADQGGESPAGSLGLLPGPRRRGSRARPPSFPAVFWGLRSFSSAFSIFPFLSCFRNHTDMKLPWRELGHCPQSTAPPTPSALLNAPLPRPASPGPPSLAPAPAVPFSSPGLGLSGGVWLPEAGSKQINPTQPWQAAARGEGVPLEEQAEWLVTRQRRRGWLRALKAGGWRGGSRDLPQPQQWPSAIKVV